MSTPAACRSRAISTASSGVTPSSPTQSLAEMRTDPGLGLGMHEIDQPLPGDLVLGRIEARTARRDAAFGAHAGHLDIDQPGAAFGALGVVGEMPVGRAAVDRLVLRHRRDD